MKLRCALKLTTAILLLASLGLTSCGPKQNSEADAPEAGETQTVVADPFVDSSTVIIDADDTAASINDTAGDLQIAAFTEDAKTAPKYAVATNLRVEGDVSASWSGVRGCCSGNTPQNNLNAAFRKWEAAQISKYRHMRYVTSGHGGGTARCSNSGGDWGSPRRCRGGVTVKAHIVFAPR